MPPLRPDRSPVRSATVRPAPLRLGLIGAGRIGTAHAETIARRVPEADLVAVADPRPGVAAAVAEPLGAVGYDSPEALIAADDVDAVVVAASSVAHAALITQVAAAGKPVWCEKPMGMTLAEVDDAIAAAEAAGVPLQVGFNRRFAADFAAARAVVDAGRIGTPQLLRSLTRDPGPWGADPATVPPGTIFTQTLIHDFDTLLWLNPGAEVVSVFATADALVAPDFKAAGLHDTAVAVLTFDNGARAVAEASFSALYGYDVRAEVFGSRGMVQAGTTTPVAVAVSDADGRSAPTVRGDVALMADAYAGEFAEFCRAVREGRTPAVTGHDARRALAVALACIESVATGAPVTL